MHLTMERASSERKSIINILITNKK